MIEFALVSMIFFILLFTVIDFSWLFFAQANLQDAVREAARYASTGQHLPVNPSDPSQGSLARVASIQNVIMGLVEGANINPSTDIVVSSANNTASPPVITMNSGGAPGDTVTVTVHGHVPLLTGVIGSFFGGSSTYNFTAQTSYQNEKFDPSLI
jgi:Flp pilus assembly protein TadG